MFEFDPVIGEMARRIKAADRRPLVALRLQLQSALPAPVLTQSIEALTYYIDSSPGTLREFASAAAASESDPLLQVAAGLYRYLVEPHDLLPDASNGVLGFLDDAWLIHNVAYRSVESQLLVLQQFSVDWNRIAMADQFALHLFPQQVKTALDGIVAQYSNLVTHRMRAFEPADTEDYSTQGKTIDDYYYTIGGTSYLSTRPIT
jgi:uncharacterized membrane protein YkvA (DUF1232 family)